MIDPKEATAAAAAPDVQIKELLRSNVQLEHFARAVAHDLQEPLRAVAGCLGILRKEYRGKLDPAADECLTLAEKGADRMHALISSLLAYSVVGTGVTKVQQADCAAIFTTALANLGESIRESGAVVTSDILPEIQADSSQMGQVFQNLIGNAIKYRQRGQAPRVHVGARRKNGAWLFSVQDNGIGVPREHAERIFEPFKRLHTRAEFEGSGIGLALCKKAVENHGGRIWLAATDPGSCFSFTIPVVQEKTAA
jgi:light-regulated signal transduction histidine kinase (bacteriophytochrome)